MGNNSPPHHPRTVYTGKRKKGPISVLPTEKDAVKILEHKQMPKNAKADQIRREWSRSSKKAR